MVQNGRWEPCPERRMWTWQHNYNFHEVCWQHIQIKFCFQEFIFFEKNFRGKQAWCGSFYISTLILGGIKIKIVCCNIHFTLQSSGVSCPMPVNCGVVFMGRGKTKGLLPLFSLVLPVMTLCSSLGTRPPQTDIKHILCCMLPFPPSCNLVCMAFCVWLTGVCIAILTYCLPCVLTQGKFSLPSLLIFSLCREK